ncbi:MAG: ATP-binding protein [Clostridiales bacterium]|nr:ATP-binding protein [Clostridiales bacterium]
MLRKFEVSNYKTFKDKISLDFGDIGGYQFSTECIYDGYISKMLIYGRNATGKTNLGKALMDIQRLLFGLCKLREDRSFLNADSVEETAVFSYEFIFDGQKVVYRYGRCSDTTLKWEELEINDELIFSCDFSARQFNFDNLSYIKVETANTERYRLSLDERESDDDDEIELPFMRWLVNNVALEKNSVLLKMFNYVRRMVFISAGNHIWPRQSKAYDTFFEKLEERKGLQEIEQFFNEMGIECQLILRKLPDGQRELYFYHERLVPFFETASSGTLALFDLYRRSVAPMREASFIYLDEFDAFYHYEMAENVIRFFKKRYSKCQIILTSHNTNLMTNRLMRPDCLFILSSFGTLTALCNATERELREGHNLEKMYISGEFKKYE